MKKYLITGALALVACATLTSCHSDDELSGSIIEQKMKAYEQVFEEEFGKVDPNQDWGFGTAEILARTRAAMARTRADGKFATTSGAYTNANMWAEDFVVPTQLTPGQKLRVQKYFQTHKNPGSAEEKTITDFFVQQVYDGYDDPMEGTDPATGKPYSPERYLAADGTTYINSGDHMDHLIVGGNHVNNFNNATYGTKGAPNTNVQSSNDEIYYEWGTKTPLDASSTEHSDQIQLMLNTTAYPWSYANSDASYVRDNRWTLVSAAVIDEWGRAAGIGEDVTDKWNRSFIGFDFDQLPDQNCYTGTTAYYGDANARYNDLVYTLAGEITAITNGDTKIIVDGKEIPYLITDQNEYCGDFVGVGGMDNLNDYNLEGAYVEGGDNDNTLYLNTLPGEQSDHKALNMNFIAKMVRAGYLPVTGKNLRKWVRIGGCNDGYYTDWIVSFMPATPVNGQEPGTITIPIEPGSEESYERKNVYYKKVSFDKTGSGRVFCEDLGVVQASDIDFNDIVFDVYIYQTDYITKHMIKTNNSSTWELDYTNYTNPIETTSTTFDGDVWLLAGGGTIPVTISIGDNGPNYSLKNVFNQAWGQEPKITDKYIVNTSKDKEGSYGNLHCNINKAVKLNDSPLAITSVADVHIEVLYGTQFYELVAYKGVAPHKIRVPLGTQWLLEREEIIKGYPRFDRYVKYQDADGNSLTEGPGATTDEEGNQIGDGKEYTHDERANSVWNTYNLSSLYVLPEDFVYTPRHQETSWSGDEEFIREEIISNGSSGSGYHNGEPVLIRRRH